MTEKKKKITRLLPCPSYDIERVESWLSDMAKEGLMLDKGSSSTVRMRFVPGTPKTVRYRLEPKPKEDRIYSDSPTPEALDLAGEFGWEFVTAYDVFYIYRTDDPNAREMSTDLTVQAATLKRLKRQLLGNLLVQIFISGEALFRFFREPYRFLVTFGWAYVALFLAFFLYLLATDIARTVHIFRLHKKLKANTPMDHEKPWKPQAKFYKVLRHGSRLVILLAVIILAGTMFKVLSTEKPSTLDSPIDPPFPTVSDLYPGKTLTSAGMDGAYNRCEQLSSNCCDQMLDWREFVNIETADGQDLGTATMIVQYYDTAAPWLARGLADDFLRRDTQWNAVDGTEILPTPDLGVDYVACYKSFFPSIILQHGDIMVQATLSDEELLLQWAEQMAQQLLNNS